MFGGIVKTENDDWDLGSIVFSMGLGHYQITYNSAIQAKHNPYNPSQFPGDAHLEFQGISNLAAKL